MEIWKNSVLLYSLTFQNRIGSIIQFFLEIGVKFSVEICLALVFFDFKRRIGTGRACVWLVLSLRPFLQRYSSIFPAFHRYTPIHLNAIGYNFSKCEDRTIRIVFISSFSRIYNIAPED